MRSLRDVVQVCESVNGGPWPHKASECPQADVAASMEYWASAPADMQERRKNFLTDPGFEVMKAQ